MVDDPPASEPVPVQDVFATDVRFDRHPEFMRLIFLADHPLAGKTELQIVGKVAMTHAHFDTFLGACAKMKRSVRSH